MVARGRVSLALHRKPRQSQFDESEASQRAASTAAAGGDAAQCRRGRWGK